MRPYFDIVLRRFTVPNRKRLCSLLSRVCPIIVPEGGLHVYKWDSTCPSIGRSGLQLRVMQGHSWSTQKLFVSRVPKCPSQAGRRIEGTDHRFDLKIDSFARPWPIDPRVAGQARQEIDLPQSPSSPQEHSSNDSETLWCLGRSMLYGTSVYWAVSEGWPQAMVKHY